MFGNSAVAQVQFQKIILIQQDYQQKDNPIKDYSSGSVCIYSALSIFADELNDNAGELQSVI